jgi:hypothetical protein
MTGANPNFVGVLVYKGLTLIVGLAFAWMGYRLFALGLTRQAGDLELQAGKGLTLKLTRAAPGIFFALLGAAIVIYSVTRILQLTESPANQTPSSSGGAPPGGRASSGVQAPAAGAATSASITAGGTPPPAATADTPGRTQPPPGTSLCDTCSAPATPPDPGATTLCDTCPAPATRVQRAVVRRAPQRIVAPRAVRPN